MPQNKQFKQFFKNTPKPASPYRERVAFKRETTARTEKTTPLKNVESPVKGEMRPAYSVDFHARERRGKTLLSYTMKCSPVEFGMIIAQWICDASETLKYKPEALARAVFIAVSDAVKKRGILKWALIKVSTIK